MVLTGFAFFAWTAARMVEVFGSRLPTFWIAVTCDVTAAALAVFCLKPLVTGALQSAAGPGAA